MISPDAPWSLSSKSQDCNKKLPEKKHEAYLSQTLQKQVIQKPGNQTQPRLALRHTGEDGEAALIK